MDTEQKIVDAEAIEIKTLSLVDATIQTAKASFAELVKESSVDKKAKELKSLLKKTEITGVDDKEGYAKVKSISKDASKIRIAIEKRRKELKSDIIIAGKNIDSLANEYQALINPIENDADAKLLLIDNAVKEAQEKAEREAKERTDNRVTELIANGISFNGSLYQLNDINVSIQFITELPTEEYDNFLAKVKSENEKNIEAKRLVDEAAKAEAEKQEALRIENEKNKAELEAGRLELRGGQLELLGIALTPEYELLIKTANNEEWKARYEQLKSDKVKAKRNEELRPYIVLIRDYNGMLEMDEAKYQKELSDIKRGEEERIEFEEKQAKKRYAEMEERSKLAVAFLEEHGYKTTHGGYSNPLGNHFIGSNHYELLTSDEELDAFKKGVISVIEKAKKEIEEKQKEYEQEVAIGQKMSRYEDLGMKYSYSKNELSWANSEGFVVIGKDTFLDEPITLYDDTVKAIKMYSDLEDEAIRKLEAIHLAKQKSDAEEAERKRKELLSEQESFAEWLSALQNITPPTLTDEVLRAKVNSIINLINQ